MIEFSKYSFIQKSDYSETCLPNHGFCLPLRSLYELKFQATFTPPNTPLIGYRQIVAFPLPLGYNLSGNIPVVLQFPAAIVASLYNASPSEVICNFQNHTDFASIDYWNQNANQFLQIRCNKCFRLCIMEVIRDGGFDGEIIQQTALTMTNCFFYYKSDVSDCFFSDISYRNNENSFGFNYELDTNFYNSLTLPMFLRSPELKSEEQTYEYLDGTNKKLYERISEEFTLETDTMPYHAHKCLKVALASDALTISNFYNETMNPFRINSEFVGAGDYNFPFDDTHYTLTKGIGKVKSKQNINLRNINCI